MALAACVPMVPTVGREAVRVASALQPDLIAASLAAMTRPAQRLQVLAVPGIAAVVDCEDVVHVRRGSRPALLPAMPTERPNGQLCVPELAPGSAVVNPTQAQTGRLAVPTASTPRPVPAP